MKKTTSRLLFFSSEFPPGPGGLGTHAFQIATKLEASGWKLIVVTPQDYAADCEIAAFNQSAGMEIVRLPSGRGILREGVHRLWVLYNALKKTQPDVVMASGERAVWLTAIICSFLGQRWVAIGHGTEYGKKRGWRPFFTRRALNRADLVIVVSEFTRRLMLGIGARPRHTVVIPNGADPTVFVQHDNERVEYFKKMNGLQGQSIILTVGQVTVRKGQEVVIRALPEVIRFVPSAHYYMIGLSTEEESLSALAMESGVADRVHFLGRLDQNEMLMFMNACNVFAMTSRMTDTGDCEGYGIAVVEAALCGKPSVVAGESGLAEAVIDGKTGFVVPPNDVKATSAALVRLLTDDSLRFAMGKCAQIRARREQTWEQTVEKYEDALLDVVSENSVLQSDQTVA